MNRKPPTQGVFDKLLAWLDPDRERAGEKYEKVRFRLIKIFGCHGCAEPERLADDTIDRVLPKIDWLGENYVGDPLLYFCGIARNVLKEDMRERTHGKVVLPLPEVANGPEDQPEYDCLDQCMQELPERNRQLVLAYYEDEGHAKILNRRKLAEELGITLRALRLRIYHIRLQLKDCMEVCLTQSPAH